MLPAEDAAFIEYRKRLIEAARVGLVAENIKFKLADRIVDEVDRAVGSRRAASA